MPELVIKDRDEQARLWLYHKIADLEKEIAALREYIEQLEENLSNAVVALENTDKYAERDCVYLMSQLAALREENTELLEKTKLVDQLIEESIDLTRQVETWQETFPNGYVIIFHEWPNSAPRHDIQYLVVLYDGSYRIDKFSQRDGLWEDYWDDVRMFAEIPQPEESDA